MIESISFDPDCIRDCMLLIEKQLILEDGNPIPINWNEIFENETLTMIYSKDLIKYTLRTLKENDYITTSNYSIHKPTGKIYSMTISNITMVGHNFIANAKNDTAWNKTKAKIKDIGGASFDTLVKLLPVIISQMLK